MAKNCYCDWNLVWWWFWTFGSGSDYHVLSKIFRSGSDTIEIFQSGSDYQISISAQHWRVSRSACVFTHFFAENKSENKLNWKSFFYENELNEDLQKIFIFYFCSCLWVKINFKFWSNYVLSTKSKACTACLAFMDATPLRTLLF